MSDYYERLWDAIRSDMLGPVTIVTHRQLDRSTPRYTIECGKWILTKDLRWETNKPGNNSRVIVDSEGQAVSMFNRWLLETIAKQREANERGTAGPQAHA
jgi:hypothetical protein